MNHSPLKCVHVVPSVVSDFVQPYGLYSQAPLSMGFYMGILEAKQALPPGIFHTKDRTLLICPLQTGSTTSATWEALVPKSGHNYSILDRRYRV